MEDIIIAKKSIVNKSTVCYTDGSSKNNGSKNSTGGIGVFFGIKDPRNISLETRKSVEILIPDYNFTDFKVTNNISELTAIIAALTVLKKNLTLKETVIIKTDSMYSINCLTKWWPAWSTNNWKKSDSKAVLNKHLLEMIVENFIKKFPGQIHFFHVRAHKECPGTSSPLYKDWLGNFQADKLASEF